MKKFVLMLLLLCCLWEPVYAADYEELTAVGRAVGIRLQESGITVTGFTETGNAEHCGLKTGDRIVRINGSAVQTAEEIGKLTASGKPVTVTVERNGAEAEYLVQPVQTSGRWVLGLRVRDSISGIGTVTFYDRESGAYGALGHGVCAVGSKKLMNLSGGELVDTTVTGSERGKRGAAGQLLGEFDPLTRLGTVCENTDQGIFGIMRAGQTLGSTYPVASAGEIRTGDAVILSNVSGQEVRQYDVRILKLYPGEAQRNLLLEVTDPELLRQTGGIVQGMSGSPIIQDGKLVGAVTHVCVNL